MPVGANVYNWICRQLMKGLLMSNLHPEVRADKNGKLVTRNIKSEEPLAELLVHGKH